MTASWKYVKRLIGLVLGLVGLISWLALQTPAMRLPSVSSHVTSDSFTFADNSCNRAAIDRADTAVDSKPPRLYGGLLPGVGANQVQTDYSAEFISRGSGYNFYLASTEVVPELRIAHLGLRNAGLRSAVDSPSRSQSATILKTNLKYQV